ncbi:MAG: MiaB/RimO family radical SAM methylthiotransferase [Dehalococcoidia bacterium]|nr:MAG: MiaB/RimO family radical SAM methylthiotransferase [Dehalococcoidia bacterium]
MPHYYIWTIGCQMNRAESERLGIFFQKLGYNPVAVANEADFIVLNSCVVRQRAEDRVVNKIKALEGLKKIRPALRMALTGCLVDSDLPALKRRFPHIDYFFKPGEYPQWFDKKSSIAILLEQPKVSTFIPIIQGCDNFCSYCVVPYRRGREKSRSLNDVIGEVEVLTERGTREVILLGQNVDSYGHDLPGKPNLASLLYQLNDIKNLARIRFLTNHPKDMEDELIGAIENIDKVCEQVNLPVQSGDDEILGKMKRDYTVRQYCKLVEKLRERVQQIALSTDVIVGFPSESKKQFQATTKLLCDLKFDTVHVAAYSLRPETLAAKEYKDDIPMQVKKERLDTIEKLQTEIAKKINKKLLGEKVEVLVEGRKKSKWHGRSRSGKLVFFTSRENLLGQLVKVRIVETSPWSLQGEISDNNRQ